MKWVDKKKANPKVNAGLLEVGEVYVAVAAAPVYETPVMLISLGAGSNRVVSLISGKTLTSPHDFTYYKADAELVVKNY